MNIMASTANSTFIKLAAIFAVALSLTACAALQPPSPNGPRSNTPPYPVIVNDSNRQESGALAWQQLSQRYGLPQNTTADLNPLLGTLHALPNSSTGSIYLPKVGDNPVQSEEETRESLRRFISDLQNLIGADLDELSLIERIDEPSGIKVARYEQRPFRYPLRGDFGILTIRFQSDRRVVDLSSSCLPNSDRLQAALNNLTPKVTAENVQSLVKGRAITKGSSSFTLAANSTVEVHQLVAYVTPSQDRQAIELHLAWEIDVTNGPIKTIYLDAITEQVIAVV
jgi:hypothetical protein